MTQLPFSGPTEVEFLNPKPGYTRGGKDGTNNYWVRFAVSKEVWELFQSAKPFMRMKGVIWEATDDESIPGLPEKKEKQPRPGTDETGDYWRYMHLANWWAIPGVREALEADVGVGFGGDLGRPEDWSAAAVRSIFEVETRREITPEMMEEWADASGIANLVTVSRNAAVRSKEK